MRIFIVALSAVGALAGSQAFAQEHDHAANARTAPPAAVQPQTQAEQHEQCKVVMGARMQPRQQHDHTREKTGHYTPPKPVSDAEMAKLHRQCADLMAKSEGLPAAAK